MLHSFEDDCKTRLFEDPNFTPPSFTTEITMKDIYVGDTNQAIKWLGI